MIFDNSIITIIIPNLNGKRFLGICLDSIMQQTFQDFSVTVVDNGSVDGSTEFVKSHYPNIQLIEFKENRGFSAAVNAGIKKTDSKYICLLNNDVELDSSFLKEIVTVLEKRKEVDYCAAKMLNYYHRNILDGAGEGVFRSGAGYRLGTLEYNAGIYDNQKEVFGACAGAAVYRQSFFEKIGHFDEDFFAYLEDVDINFRANLFGLRCLYVPAAKVFHIGSGTTGSTFNSFIVRLTTKNIFNVVVKNYPTSIFLKNLHVIFLYHVWWFFSVLKRKQLFAYLRGVEGALHDFPKMWKKRKKWLSRKSISNEEYGSKIVNSERDVMSSILRRRKSAGKLIWLINLYINLN